MVIKLLNHEPNFSIEAVCVIGGGGGSSSILRQLQVFNKLQYEDLFTTKHLF